MPAFVNMFVVPPLGENPGDATESSRIVIWGAENAGVGIKQLRVGSKVTTQV